MHRIGHGADIALEQTASVGIGDHDPCHIGTKLVLKGRQIHPAGFIPRDGIHRKAALHRRGRIGTMGGVRRQHPGPGLPLTAGNKSSPWAPAFGDIATAGIPVSSFSQPAKRSITSSAPCTVD